MLLEIITRISDVTNRKSTVYIFRCDSCSSRFEGSACRNKGKFHFCNNKCKGDHRREHKDLWPDSSVSLNSKQAHDRSATTIKEKAARGEWKHMTGHRHSEKTKRHLSEIRKERGLSVGDKNGMFGRKHTEQTRAKMSDTKTRLMNEGKFCPPFVKRTKKGEYVSTKSGQLWRFRSSWEEAVMKHLDADPDVVSWEYESIRISYYYNEAGKLHKRWYVPDFVVKYSDGTTRVLEVKPKEFSGEAKTARKAEAARAWCAENGASYMFVTREVMREWKIEV